MASIRLLIVRICNSGSMRSGVGDGGKPWVVVMSKSNAEYDTIKVEIAFDELLARALQYLHRVICRALGIFVLHVVCVPEAVTRLIPESVVEVDIARLDLRPRRRIFLDARLRAVL